MHKYVKFNFSEDWHNYHYGIDFNEDFWTDPIKRTEAYREMSYLRAKTFPDTVCSYIVNPEFYEGKSKEEIDALVRNIVINGGPTDKISILRTYGVSRNATNDNVMDLYSSIERQGFCGETKIQ